MSVIKINEDTTFSPRQVEEMLGIKQNRIVYLCTEAKKVPYTKTLGDKGHIRIRFGDLDKVIEAHENTRQVGVNKSGRKSIAMRVSELERRIAELEQIVDEYTAPEVASIP